MSEILYQSATITMSPNICAERHKYKHTDRNIVTHYLTQTNKQKKWIIAGVFPLMNLYPQLIATVHAHVFLAFRAGLLSRRLKYKHQTVSDRPRLLPFTSGFLEPSSTHTLNAFLNSLKNIFAPFLAPRPSHPPRSSHLGVVNQYNSCITRSCQLLRYM